MLSEHKTLALRFFSVRGRGTSDRSPEHAYQIALKNSGIAHLNLVAISIPGVLPESATEIQPGKIPPGSVVWGTIARCDTAAGESRTVGVGTAFAESSELRYRIGYTACGRDETEVRGMIAKKLQSKALALALPLSETSFLVQAIEECEGQFGAAVAVFGILPMGS